MNKKINHCRLLPDLLKTHYKYIPLIRHNIKWVSEGIIEIFLNILLSVNTNLNFDTYLHSFYLTNFLVFLARSRELINNMLSTELLLRFERRADTTYPA